jgi:hypothetical protein
MKRLLLFVLLLVSASFALDFKLDHVVSDWGHGCQYYNITNTDLASSLKDIPTATIAPGATSTVKDAGWETLITENLSYQVWIPNVKCVNTTSPNMTIIEDVKVLYYTP